MTQDQEKWLALQQETEGLEWWEDEEGRVWAGNKKELESEYEQLGVEDKENQPDWYKWLEDQGIEEIGVPEYDENSEDWKVYTDSEADDAWDEQLDNYIEECILPEIHQAYRYYFDKEKWKNDAKYDGRGHSLARYDGHEQEQEVNGTTYYLYRQN